MKSSVLITGANGQVGRELARHSWPDGVVVQLADHAMLDLTNQSSIDRCVDSIGPDGIINCAAYTAVDRAEDEPGLAYDVNARGAGGLARSARLAGIPMIHVSTDYVFGATGGGYRSEDDPVSPLGVYGASKLAGEIAAAAACDRLAIVRTAWVVSPFRTNFVKTMLRLASDRDEISVVADQRGCPTGASDLAGALATMMMRMIADEHAPRGIFHFVNAGDATWADLADVVMGEARRHGLPSARIKRIASVDFPTRAARPIDSRLDTGRIRRDYSIVPRKWEAMVASTVAELAGTPTGS